MKLRRSRQSAQKDYRIKFLFSAVLTCCLTLQLAACGGGSGLGGAAVDDTLVTGDVAGGKRPQPDVTQVSDEMTIRNAVSSADLAAADGRELSWANVDTGSRGSIMILQEYADKGLLCRKFNVSRESFDGVRLYNGDACRSADGSWRMLTFAES